MVEGLTSQRLQNWFNADIRAHFSEEVTCKIPKLIVPDGWESTLGAVEGMVDRERTAAFTLSWQAVWTN